MDEGGLGVPSGGATSVVARSIRELTERIFSDAHDLESWWLSGSYRICILKESGGLG